MNLTKRDAFFGLLNAALNLKGGEKGAAVASLIGTLVPTSFQLDTKKAIAFLTEKFAEIETRIAEISSKTINIEELADLLKGFERVIANTNREEKLRAAANIVANSLLPPSDPAKSAYEELDHLMHCVDALSIGAIQVLGASIQVRRPRHVSEGDTPFYFPELRSKLPGYDPDLIAGLASELRALNLLHIIEGDIGNRNYENYQYRVTRMGSHFAERFIEGRFE